MTVVQEAYDRLAEEYDDHFLRPVDIAENICVFSELDHWPGRMLDLGCGTGLLLEYCNPPDYVGVDISRAMLAVAHRKFPEREFRRQDMSALQLDSGAFDCVVSTFGSFSYCLRPVSAVAEVFRVLRPGGSFFIMVYGERYARRESYIAKDEHLPQIRYTAARLRSLFAGARDLIVFGVSSRRMEWLSGRVPQAVLNWLLRAESRTIGRLSPEYCYWLVARGMK